jgi:hypothetical protein
VTATDLVYATHAIPVEDGEHERQRLAFLPEYELDEAKAVVRDEAGHVLAVTARDPKALALLFHKRFGHMSADRAAFPSYTPPAKPERPIGEFLTAEQLQLLEVQDDYEEAIAPSRGRGRPPSENSRSQRSRTPSAQALRNLPDADSPPDVFAEAQAHFNARANELEHERDVIKHFAGDLNFTTWRALERDLEHKVGQVYAEVFATLGSGEDERDYHKLRFFGMALQAF